MRGGRNHLRAQRAPRPRGMRGKRTSAAFRQPAARDRTPGYRTRPAARTVIPLDRQEPTPSTGTHKLASRPDVRRLRPQAIAAPRRGERPSFCGSRLEARVLDGVAGVRSHVTGHGGFENVGQDRPDGGFRLVADARRKGLDHARLEFRPRMGDQDRVTLLGRERVEVRAVDVVPHAEGDEPHLWTACSSAPAGSCAARSIPRPS